MIVKIYPTELQLKTLTLIDTKVSVLDLNLSLSNAIYIYIFFFFFKIYDTHDDFDFSSVKFTFVDSDFPLSFRMEFTYLSLFV